MGQPRSSTTVLTATISGIAAVPCNSWSYQPVLGTLKPAMVELKKPNGGCLYRDGIVGGLIILIYIKKLSSLQAKF
jgi:hypothetical protein